MTATASAIQFEQVDVRYGEALALEAVSFSLPVGGICALCGPNGAGKSTTIKLICGLLRPTSGGGQVLGEALTARPARRRA